MASCFPLPLLAAVILCIPLAVPLPAQQASDPAQPVPSGREEGLTRDALETPAETPHPVGAATPPHHTSSHRATSSRGTTAGTRKSATYTAISHHHRRHRARSHSAAMTASTAPAKKPARHRAPLVSFIYWWNGWVMRTFHTRSGTVLLDHIGAKS